LNYVQQIFPGVAKTILGGFSPLVTGLLVTVQSQLYGALRVSSHYLAGE